VSVTEVLGGLGSWSLRLNARTPREIRDALGFFGHVAIVNGPADVDASGDGLLAGARYVGVLRGRTDDPEETGALDLDGSGMVFWLGDEDDKGPVLEAAVTLTNVTLASAVATLLAKAPGVSVGTVHPQPVPAARYTGRHQFQTVRTALSSVCDAFGVEFRVNGDGSVGVGTVAQLFGTTVNSIVRRGMAGSDIDLKALAAKFATEQAAYDYTGRVVLLGRTIGVGDEPDETFATGSADLPVLVYRDIKGNLFRPVRMISESGETEGSVDARAGLHINRFGRIVKALDITAEDYESDGSFRVGQAVYVYDPEAGVFDAAREVFFRGEVIHPDLIRVTEATWQPTPAMTVAFRTGTGTWLDLTPFVTWETGSDALVVGDLPRSISKPSGDSAVAIRADAAQASAPDKTTPNPPTNLTVTSDYYPNPLTGVDVSVLQVAWNAPATNTDGSVITDLDHYEVRWQWTGRAGGQFAAWQATSTEADTIDLAATSGLEYEVQVAAVDHGGKRSTWATTGPVIAAADEQGPPAPEDPVAVTGIAGAIKVTWSGKTATGTNFPADTNRLDLHMGETADFVATPANRITSVPPNAAGSFYPTTPYLATRYFRLIGVDHNGNPGPSSAVVTGSSVKVQSSDVFSLSVALLTSGQMSADVVMAGRFTTASVGARREMNQIGFQAFDAAENLTINLDGVNNLLTGRFRTGLPGTRRVEIGAAGASGRIEFYAPDGTKTEVGGFTGGPDNSAEAIRMGVVMPGVSQFWNKGQVDSGGGWYHWSAFHKIVVGGNGPETLKRFEIAWATNRGTESVATIPDTIRVSIDATDEWHYIPDNGAFQVWERTSAGLKARAILREGSLLFYSGDGDLHGSIEMRNGLNNGSWVESQVIQFTTPRVSMPNGGVYSARFYYAIGLNGANHGYEFFAGGIYAPLKASAFQVSSDRDLKESITDAEFSGLDLLRSPRVRRYKAKRGKDSPITPAEEIGLVAQEAPEIMQAESPNGSKGIDLYRMISVIGKAVQELDAEVESLKGKGGKP